MFRSHLLGLLLLLVINGCARASAASLARFRPAAASPRAFEAAYDDHPIGSRSSNDDPKRHSLWQYLTDSKPPTVAADSHPTTRLEHVSDSTADAVFCADGIEVTRTQVRLEYQKGYLIGPSRSHLTMAAGVVPILSEWQIGLGLNEAGELLALRYAAGTAFFGPIPYGAGGGPPESASFRRAPAIDTRSRPAIPLSSP